MYSRSGYFANLIVAPAAANGGRTPAWKAAGDGGRTPAWNNDGSRTVNPYDGSRTAYGAGNRTPAWAPKTPAYTGGQDGFASGSKTPAYGGNDGWGSKTPAYQSNSSSSHNEWSSNTASGGWSSGGQQNYTSYDAPTPGAHVSAPTPAAMNAPTPGAYSAPTPAASAPTPAAGWGGGWGGAAESAPTPAAMNMATPGAGQGYYGAPTPAGYGHPETPAANWGQGDEDGPRYED